MPFWQIGKKFWFNGMKKRGAKSLALAQGEGRVRRVDEEYKKRRNVIGFVFVL
jgi:hypothetical protein